MNDHYSGPQSKIVRTLARIYSRGMTTSSGGNISIMDAAGDLWITPARLDKGSLRPDDVACIKAAGGIEGAHPPSSEYPFHSQIYRARPDIRAIIHGHPAGLVAYSMAGQMPDLSLLPTASQICGPVGLAKYHLPGSAELGESIARVFARGADCVIMQNHGVVCGGQTVDQTFTRFQTLETCAQILIRSGQLAMCAPPDIRQIDLAAGAESNLPLDAADSPPSRVHDELCRFFRRGCDQRLFSTRQGTISTRLDADSFLINCHGVDRLDIQPSDLALIRQGRCLAAKPASRFADIHHAIYRRHPQVSAIVTATPIHATAFSVANILPEVRSLPESYLLLRDISSIPLATLITNADGVAEAVSLSRPAALLQHEGVLLLGRSLLEAFDRLEVLEATAQATFLARVLGDIKNIPAAALDELAEKYKL